jgi:hypothetical protein
MVNGMISKIKTNEKLYDYITDSVKYSNRSLMLRNKKKISDFLFLDISNLIECDNPISPCNEPDYIVLLEQHERINMHILLVSDFRNINTLKNKSNIIFNDFIENKYHNIFYSSLYSSITLNIINYFHLYSCFNKRSYDALQKRNTHSNEFLLSLRRYKVNECLCKNVLGIPDSFTIS